MNYFSLPFQDYGHLTPYSWLQQLWGAVSKYGIAMYKPNSSMKVPRKHDFALMDRVIQSKIFNRDEIMSINRCRLFLQVFYLSDIVTCNGEKILPEALNGKFLLHPQSRWKWPRQPRPPKKDWKMWTLAINEAWILSETQFLHYPLGDWINDTHQIHKFVYCLDTSAIFETFTNGDIHEYRKVEHKTQNARNYVFL